MSVALPWDQWLQPIAAEAPSGPDLRDGEDFTLFMVAAKGTEEQYDGKKVIPGKDPDWPTLVADGSALGAKTRDLRILLHLIRAHFYLEGLPALHDGIAFLREAVRQYWDSLHPQLDPDDDLDPVWRLNLIETLSDRAAFICRLEIMPLCRSRGGAVCLLDILRVRGASSLPPGGNPELTLDQILSLFTAAPRDEVTAQREAAARTIAVAHELEAEFGRQAAEGEQPNLTPLCSALQQVQTQLDFILKQLPPVTTTTVAAANDERAPEAPAALPGSAPAAAQVPGQLRNREDAIRLMRSIEQYFERHEPTSPVPLLIRRARALAEVKDFWAVIKDLAPSATDQIAIILGPEPTGEPPKRP